MPSETVNDGDPLDADLRQWIQNAALSLLATNEHRNHREDPDHPGRPYVLTEEVQMRLYAQGAILADIHVDRALREDPCFYSRYRHGVHMYFLKLRGDHDSR